MQTFFELLPEKQNTSAALGFFDGLHIGHRKVIGEAVRGSENGLVPICVTFAQSPKSVLKNQPQEALMSVEDKKQRCQKSEYSTCICAISSRLLMLRHENLWKIC